MRTTLCLLLACALLIAVVPAAGAEDDPAPLPTDEPTNGDICYDVDYDRVPPVRPYKC